MRTKKGRSEQSAYLAEGTRLLEEAVRHRVRPSEVLCAESMLTDRSERLVEVLSGQKVPIVSVSRRDMVSLADTETPQGLVGVFATPGRSLAKLYRSQYRKLLWCENISDPGNLGTLIRSALAFGFGLVVTSGQTAEAYSPKVVRASAGAIFGVAVASKSVGDVLRFIDKEEFNLVATVPNEEADEDRTLKQVRQTKLVLAVGGEARGLTPRIVQRATHRIRVNHSDKVESLNAAIAGSIVMKELYTVRG